MTPPDEAARLRVSQNLARVRQQIAAAAARAGRPASDVRLVGVTKYVDPPTARLLVEAGLHELGESRPQALWEKAAALADLPVGWHLIGHLQRNKARRTLALSPLVHSADSLKLLADISGEAAQSTTPVRVLLEVNVSGDEAKHGFGPGELEPLLPQIAALPGLAVQGLMTMAALAADADRTRREFATLRQLRDRLAINSPSNVVLSELSMGMSGDFEIAIEEGATIVRIGSTLFDGLLTPTTDH